MKTVFVCGVRRPHCSGSGSAAVMSNIDNAERIKRALDLAVRFGGIDGEHHKTWVIDQMVRALVGDGYDELVREARGEDGS